MFFSYHLPLCFGSRILWKILSFSDKKLVFFFRVSVQASQSCIKNSRVTVLKLAKFYEVERKSYTIRCSGHLFTILVKMLANEYNVNVGYLLISFN